MMTVPDLVTMGKEAKGLEAAKVRNASAGT
jgi:hypothetical protein